MALLGSNNDYWRAILISAGGAPLPGDTDLDLLRRLADASSVAWVSDDTARDVIAKIVGTPIKSGDTFNDLLRRFYFSFSSTDAAPGSSDNDLLRIIANNNFPLSIPVPENWTLEYQGEGVVSAHMLFDTPPPGADQWAVRFAEYPDGEFASPIFADVTESINSDFIAGDTIQAQVAWVKSGATITPWSTIKTVLLG